MKTKSTLTIVIVMMLAMTFYFAGYGCSRAQSNINDQGIVETKEFKELKAKAEKGDTEAQSKLGDCYYAGEVVPQNYEEAISWWRKAADYKHTDAAKTSNPSKTLTALVPTGNYQTIRFEDKQTILHKILSNPTVSIDDIKFLCRLKDFPINAQDNDGFTALHYAAVNTAIDMNIILCLLDFKADPMIKCRDTKTENRNRSMLRNSFDNLTLMLESERTVTEGDREYTTHLQLTPEYMHLRNSIAEAKGHDALFPSQVASSQKKHALLQAVENSDEFRFRKVADKFTKYGKDAISYYLRDVKKETETNTFGDRYDTVTDDNDILKALQYFVSKGGDVNSIKS